MYKSNNNKMTLTSTNLNIEHDAEHHMFYIKVKGGSAELIYDKHADDYLDFKSTYVPEASRGFGIAGKLAEHALIFARQNQYKVKPTCPFIKDYIDKNPEYKALTFE